MKYYLHDTSAFDDEKVSELYINFGYEGVGLFYVILEKLGKQEKPVKTSVLKSQLRIGKKLEKCWKFMETIGLISSNNGETFNKQLLNFSEKYQIKKEKNAKRISEWRKNQLDSDNVTCYENVCNTPKVKESKVNEIEIKENKDINISFVPGKPETTPPVPFEKIVNAYNTICTNLPKCKELSEGRKKKIRARFTQLKSLDGFILLFDRAAKTAFLNGKNDKGWKASLDWMIENDTNYLKIMEGKYDKPEKSVEITDPNRFRKDGTFGTL